MSGGGRGGGNIRAAGFRSGIGLNRGWRGPGHRYGRGHRGYPTAFGGLGYPYYGDSYYGGGYETAAAVSYWPAQWPAPPAVPGIAPSPSAPPVVYVLNTRSDRRRLDRRSDAQDSGPALGARDGRRSGPRIVHIDVARGS
jgi:hypothetical protein